MSDDIQLNEAEKKLILAIRRERIEYGRIQCIIYITDGKLVRVELEKAMDSIKL